MDVQPLTRSLTGQLQAPADFLNVTNVDDMAGYYIFGHEAFRVLDKPVAGILHRSFAGRQEDFVLGVISVLLIALLSEIVQTVLMRTREKKVTRQGLHTAYVLDEVYHFRNVWRLVCRDPQCRERGSRTRRIAYNSLMIVFLALVLLAAEVFAVYLTQPVKVYSTEHQFNVIGRQPAGTTYETAVHIDNLTKKKRCVTPSMRYANQSREYSINACIMRNYELSMMDENAVATWITIASWYHEAGGDHEITFGDDNGAVGKHQMETRAFIMKSYTGETKAIRFSVEDPDLHFTKYLQKFMIYTAIEWNCRQENADRSCQEMIDELREEDAEPEQREVKLWTRRVRGERDQVTETADMKGIKCRFNVTLKNPFASIENALHVFATSSVIIEVDNADGMYMGLDEDGTREDSFPGLVSEEGRVAGLVLLLVIFGALLLALILLRIFLRPISLARLARSTMDDEFEEFDDFLGAGPKLEAELRPPIISSGSLITEDRTPRCSPRKHRPLFGKGRKVKERDERVTDLSDYVSESEDYQSSVTTADV